MKVGFGCKQGILPILSEITVVSIYPANISQDLPCNMHNDTRYQGVFIEDFYPRKFLEYVSIDISLGFNC